MQRAIARQAEAERERRAKIIAADGEFQAAAEALAGGRDHQPEPGRRCSSATCRRCSRWASTRTRRSSSRCRIDLLGAFMQGKGTVPPVGPTPAASPHPTSPPPERSRGPHRPAHRAAGDPRPRPRRAPRRLRADARRVAPRRGRDLPVLRGPGGPHAARGLGGSARRRGEPDTPGWLQRSVPNLYPVLAGAAGRGGNGRRPRPGWRARSTRSAPRGGRGEPDLFRAQPAHGAHEVIVHDPRAR